ncbi:hypothetical protein N0V85_005355 [Neurospora sp. IMI 360204]|nr:hypothetical protein N0V85_005355 [Neurospora sp. IMI 360204]
MEDQGQPVAAAPPANTRGDDHTAPDADGFLINGFPADHHLRIHGVLRSQQQQQQRNYRGKDYISDINSFSTRIHIRIRIRTGLSFKPAPQVASPSARHVVDKLAHELSVQNLQRDALQLEPQSLVQQQQQQQQRKEQEQQQVPLSPPTAMSLVPDTAATTTTAHPQSWAGIGSLEVDDGIEMDDAFELDGANLRSLLPPSFRQHDYSSSAAPSIPNAPSSSSANTSEKKRQVKHNAQTQSRSIQALVEEMIKTGTQCNVRSAPLPAPSAPLLSTLDDLKVDHGYDFASMELEVDERYLDGTVDVLEEERALLESIQVRRAGSGPAGIRKHTVEGTLPLRYQLSAEAAMRCATVVRSRPRMRRRKEHGTGSVTSSVAYSTNSSPMAQPVQPSEQLPSQYLPAIPSSSHHTPP